MKVNSGQAPSTLIPEYIGSDFDKIVAVADNLNDTKLVLENINSVVTVANNILDVNKVASIADDVTLVADNIDYIKNAATGNGGSGGTSGGSGGTAVRGYIGDTPPIQPAAGATWYCTLDGRTYTWYEDDDSGQWVESSPQGATETVVSYIGGKPPAKPLNGAEWYCTTDGRSYVWYLDNDSGQWVESSPQGVTEEAASEGVTTHEAKAGAHSIAGVSGLQQALDSKESSGSAASAVSAHEAKAGAHSISGVAGLQGALDGKEAAGAAASAVSAHKAEQDAHEIADITGLADALASIGGGSGGSGGAFGGQYRNLVVTVSGVGYQGTITADRLVVEGADYSTKILRNVNLSFNGANSGVNGLDTGTAAAGNWYYIFAIYNPTTDTTASLISLSMKAPTLPAGYTMAAILGAAYVAAGATAFMSSVKKDFETSLGAGGVQGYVTILSGGAASVMTSVSTVTASPNISSAIYIVAFASGGYAGVFTDNVSTLGAKCGNDAAPWLWAAQKQQGVLFYQSSGGLVTIRIIGYRTPF